MVFPSHKYKIVQMWFTHHLRVERVNICQGKWLVFRVNTSVMPRPKRNADRKCSKFDGQSPMQKMTSPPQPSPKILNFRFGLDV